MIEYFYDESICGRDGQGDKWRAKALFLLVVDGIIIVHEYH
jgi:hypothetical protein